MSEIRPTLLRLKQTTVDKLKLAVSKSAHRSMATLADEILDEELSRRLGVHSDEIDQMVEAVRRGQQP